MYGLWVSILGYQCRNLVFTVLMIATGLCMFTYKSTDFSAIGFIMVLSARSGKPHPLCFLLVLCSYQGVTKRCRLSCSVADPGCLSRIPDPDFYPSRIPDPGSRIPDPKTETKERGEKKFVIPFYVATNFTKLKIILVLKCWRKKFGPIFIEL